MNSTGSGNCRPKDWQSLLTAAVDRIKGADALRKDVRKLIKAGDYLTACDVVRDCLGRNEFNDFLREQFLDPKFQPAPIHEHIEQIDSRFILTPNFDKIYDGHVAAKQGNSVIVKTYSDLDLAECARISQRVIIKYHGTIDSPAEMIFTREDYANARVKFQSCYEVISALILTHTFVFLGCGLSDPDAALLLEHYAFAHKYGRHHYFVTGKASLPRKEIYMVLGRTRNIRFLPYDSANNHQQLTKSLGDLASQVNAERQNLSRTQNW